MGKRAISAGAFATVLLIALMMGANHVSARIAFNNDVDVATAVVFCSTVTALVVSDRAWAPPSSGRVWVRV